MIKFISALLLLISSYSALGVTYESSWSVDYKKSVIMSCGEDEYQCEDFCGEKICKIEEKVCRNCIGSNLLITHIFRDMGRTFRNSGNEISYYEVLETLSTNLFASFTSKSIYNIVERYDSPKLRKKFQSLCDNGTEYPVVIFGINKVSRILDEVKFVLCGDQAFEMSNDAIVDVNEKAQFKDIKLY